MIPGIVAGRAVAPAWTPAHMTTPVGLWMDWESPVTDVSGNASVWEDRSGNGRHHSQGTASARPAINPTAINGKRALEFDGVNDALTCQGALGQIFQGVQNGWAFTLYNKRTSATPSASACVFYAAASTTAGHSNRFNVISSRSATPGFGAFASRRQTTDATVILGRSTSDVGSWVMRIDMSDWAAGDVFMFVDGALDASDTSTMTSGTTSSANMGGTWVGCGGITAPAANTFSDADIAAVIAGNSGLPSASEIDRLFGYVAHECALQSSLPDDHPFRHVRPYVNTPVLQPSFASDPVVLGFVAEAAGGDIGVAVGDAVASEFGALLNSEPELTTGEGITVVSDGTDITVRLDDLTPPATPAQAVVIDHKGAVIVTIPLTDFTGYFAGSEPGEFEDGGVYYVRIEEA